MNPYTGPVFSKPEDIHLPIGTWMFHIHHEQLAEMLTEPLQARLDYIRDHKPESEKTIRLALISPVRGKLPPELDKARAAYDKARAAYDKAGAAYSKAGSASGKAYAAYSKAYAASVKAGAASVKAYAASVKAGAAYDKARAAYGKARAAYGKAGAAALPALEALHATEHPGCPWDGRTIFGVAS